MTCMTEKIYSTFVTKCKWKCIELILFYPDMNESRCIQIWNETQDIMLWNVALQGWCKEWNVTMLTCDKGYQIATISMDISNNNANDDTLSL